MPVTRAQINLPEDMFLFGCLQRAYKMHPLFDIVIKNILQLAGPNARLVVLSDRTERIGQLYLERLARSLGLEINKVIIQYM